MPPQDAKGFQTSHQTHLKVRVSHFQMCLLARLKALCILRLNLGSDIKLHDLRSSAMVLIDVDSKARI